MRLLLTLTIVSLFSILCVCDEPGSSAARSHVGQQRVPRAELVARPGRIKKEEVTMRIFLKGVTKSQFNDPKTQLAFQTAMAQTLGGTISARDVKLKRCMSSLEIAKAAVRKARIHWARTNKQWKQSKRMLATASNRRVHFPSQVYGNMMKWKSGKRKCGFVFSSRDYLTKKRKLDVASRGEKLWRGKTLAANKALMAAIAAAKKPGKSKRCRDSKPSAVA